MTGPNAINSVPLNYFVNGPAGVQEPQNAQPDAQPGAVQNQPDNAPAQNQPRAGELMQKLDVLLVKAAKTANTSISGTTIKKDLQKLVTDGALTKDDLQTLANTANAARKAFTTLNGFTGRQLAAAFKPDGTLDAESPAGKAISEAISTQNDLSDALARLDKRLDAVSRHSAEMLQANPDFKGVDPELHNAIIDMRMHCDRRATEINRLAYQMRDFAVELAAQGQNADPNIKAILAAKVDDLLPRQALAMHGTGDALTSVNDEVAAKLRPLAAQIDAFRTDPKASLDSSALIALQSDINTMKSAITDIRNNGVQVPGGRMMVDSDIIRALEEELTNVEKSFSTAKADVGRQLCSNFISTFKGLLTADAALEAGWARKHPERAALFAKRDAFFKKMEDFAAKVLDPKLNNDQVNALYKELVNECLELSQAAVRTKAAGPKEKDAKQFNHVRLSLITAMPNINHLGTLAYSIRESGALLSGAEAMSLFNGKLSVSALVETRVRGLADADVDEANDDSNIVSSRPLGSGNAGTVYELERSDGSQVIFKGESESRAGLYTIAAGAGNAHTLSQHTANLNIAARKAAEALGMGGMIVKYTVGTRKGVFGFYMDKAPGMEAYKITKKGVRSSEQTGLTQEEIKALPENEKRQIKADLQRELNRLQWLDLMTGQMDRHYGNYFVHIDRTSHKVTVTGIDNDAGYTQYRVGAATFALDKNRTDTFMRSLREMAQTCGYKNNPQAFVDKMLADPGITVGRDGNVTIDASKIQNKALGAILRQTVGAQAVAIPDKIDRETYESFMALKSGPKRQEYLDSIRSRLSEKSYQAAVSRLDDVIAHAERLAAEGKIVENEPNGWPNVTEPVFDVSPITVEDPQGNQVPIGNRNSAFANCTLSPSFFTRDYLDKLF